MPPPTFFNPAFSGICLADGNYAYLPVTETLAGTMLSTPGSNITYVLGADPRFVSYQPGMTPLFANDPDTSTWEGRRQAVLRDLARPFPPEQYELRDRLIRQLQSEGLNARNAQEIGQALETLGLRIPRPPRQQPRVEIAVSEPALRRVPADMEREAVEALRRSRTLVNPSDALPESIDVYRFDRTRKIREARPVAGSAYSPMDRTLIVVDGTPGGTFSIDAMNQQQWDAFRSDAVHRGYAVTNPRANGEMRSDARTLEYHIIADSIDDATLRYFRENNPFVRVIRYSSVADIAAGRGEVLIDTPRQYLRADLEREGTLHEAGDFVEVRNGDTVVRRFPKSQVTNEFYHYTDRLPADRAAQVRAVAEARGWDLSQINREQGAELLSILQGDEYRWDVELVHAFIGSEGMRSYYNRGTAELPFGFGSTGEFQLFRSDLFEALEGQGLPISSGEARVILSGSAMSGYSTKGGQFRWSETIDAEGNPRAPSDYDIKVVVTQEVFNQWVDRSLGVLATERLRKGLRHYIGKTDGIRWAELPPSLREGLRPLMERYPRIQQITIALDGGYWHALDPQADSMRVDLTANLNPADLVCRAPAADAPASLVADTANPAVVSVAAVPAEGDVSPPVDRDNVLLRGDRAVPTGNIDPAVVRSQLVLRYPRFLSQAAREALQDGRTLPTGADLVNSAFETDVRTLTDSIVAEYAARRRNSPESVDGLWRDEARDNGFVVRDGVPDRLMKDVVADYVARESARSGSPFTGLDGAFRSDGNRPLEADAYERSFRDLLRDMGR